METKYVGVRFYQDTGNGMSSKIYIYKTSMDFQIGDHCIVSVREEQKVVCVVARDDQLSISERAQATKWVEGRVADRGKLDKERKTIAKLGTDMADMVERYNVLNTLNKVEQMAIEMGDKKLMKKVRKYRKITGLGARK